MKSSVYSLAVLGVSTLIAFTAPAKAMEPEKWQGLYVGFQSGWVGADENLQETIAGSPNLDIEGFLAGLVGGYNFRHAQWLFGVEVDGAIVDAGDEVSPCGSTPCRLDWDNLGTFRGRVGWIFGSQDQFAVYATGGLATAGWQFTSVADNEHFVFTGWVVGGGFEGYLFDTNWISNKVEYNYVDFGGSENFSTGSVTGGSVSADAHILKFGLNIHF